ncbi:hypothetical protein EB118_16275 [bacterium]|nr:hypothetical protein [bacterium]
MESTEYKLPTLSEFYDMLEHHDWSYQYSDDHRYWRRGQQQMAEIRTAIDSGGKAYSDLFEQWDGYAWREKDSNIPKPIKP